MVFRMRIIATIPFLREGVLTMDAFGLLREEAQVDREDFVHCFPSEEEGMVNPSVDP